MGKTKTVTEQCAEQGVHLDKEPLPVRLFSKSKRQFFVFLMLALFILGNGAIIGALIQGSIMDEFGGPILTAYNMGYGALAGLVFGYIWGETTRPHVNPKDLLDNVRKDFDV